MFFDIALIFDPATRTCDIGIAGGDLAIDTTPATPLMVSLGSDRRADPDDVVPDVLAGSNVFNARRGWPGDALDASGRRTGSRLWLLYDQKQTEDTRLLALSAAQQATQWIADDRGVAVQCAATWLRRGWLAVASVVGNVTVSLPVAVG